LEGGKEMKAFQGVLYTQKQCRQQSKLQRKYGTHLQLSLA
jgi:hypothetical protein